MQHLLALFVHALGARVAELHENGIRLRFIGERSAFNDGLRRGMAEAEQLTANNDGMTLAIAVNYGGQWDLTQAARHVAQQVRDGELAVEQITDAELGRHVSLADLPLPDLLIRTGGEQRLSNFLLWQAAYSEFYFTPTLWPDFDGQALDRALADYASRQRRFGRSGEEVSRLDGDSSC